MSEQINIARDEKGDVIFDQTGFDWEKFRVSAATYVFHYYDKEREDYVPYFGLFSLMEEELLKANEDPNFFEKKLYWTPDRPPYDFYIKYHNWQLGLLVKYFKEVFEQRAFFEGYVPNHEFFHVILPKPLHDEIINCINDYELLPIRDLLFEIIAIAQHKYVEEVAFWERPENQKLVTSARKESEKAIKVIEKLEDFRWVNNEIEAGKQAELLAINFIFNDESIKIEHNWLAREFIKSFKKEYDDFAYKDWRLELERYPTQFEKHGKQHHFKYKLAKSFYNLLTGAQFFKTSTKQPTPNKLMLCIARMLEFCLIPVGDPDEGDDVKIRYIRNWIKRKDFQPDITHLEVPIDRARLGKYFEPEFINSTGEVKKADALSIASYIAKRFNIEHLIADLAHLAQAIKEMRFIGHQLIGENRAFQPQFDEFKAFSTLVNGIRNNSKVQTIKFKIEGDDKEYELTQRLPLYLIEQSIKEYSEEQQVEFDTELVKTTVVQTSDNSLQVKKDEEFCQPHERFMVRFVHSFYQYLLNEDPPKQDSDMIPSSRYYAIIANLLQQTWFFHHKRHPESFVIEKVKQWHALALVQ